MRSLNFLAKILNLSYYLFFTITFCVMSYFLYLSYLDYKNIDQLGFIYKIITVLAILIYISIIGKLKSRIEMRIYKENYELTIIPIIVQAILYGVITPFSIVNYYVIYMLLVNNNTDFLKKVIKSDQKYYIVFILLNIGFITYLLHMLIKYLELLVEVFNEIVNKSANQMSFGFLFTFFMLFIWLILIRIALKFYHEKKYIECAVLSIVVGILANPFTFHGICLLTSGIIIFSQDNHFDKLKTKALEIKERFVKK